MPRRIITPSRGMKTRRMCGRTLRRFSVLRVCAGMRRSRQKRIPEASQPKNITRQVPSRPHWVNANATSSGPSERPSSPAAMKKPMPLPSCRPGEARDHGRRRRVKCRPADTGHKEQNDQRSVAWHQANKSYQGSGDGRHKDDEVTHAEAVAQPAYQHAEERGNRHGQLQRAGQTERDRQLLEDDGQQGRHKGRVHVVHEVPANDSENVLCLEGLG